VRRKSRNTHNFGNGQRNSKNYFKENRDSQLRIRQKMKILKTIQFFLAHTGNVEEILAKLKEL